ncbi:unnamed protein product [Trichogramma brassicae]|uniref:Uncharacterized protein n=1 Tax=Trichogramma brassicae TaxID=86971 RepID=A0A6H5IVB2_9HYME|nr:unnamed protein product [Trichogramma brassicae]
MSIKSTSHEQITVTVTKEGLIPKRTRKFGRLVKRGSCWWVRRINRGCRRCRCFSAGSSTTKAVIRCKCATTIHCNRKRQRCGFSTADSSPERVSCSDTPLPLIPVPAAFGVDDDQAVRRRQGSLSAAVGAPPSAATAVRKDADTVAVQPPVRRQRKPSTAPSASLSTAPVVSKSSVPGDVVIPPPVRRQRKPSTAPSAPPSTAPVVSESGVPGDAVVPPPVRRQRKPSAALGAPPPSAAAASSNVNVAVVSPPVHRQVCQQGVSDAVIPSLVQGQRGSSLPAPATDFVASAPLREVEEHQHGAIPFRAVSSPPNDAEEVVPELNDEFGDGVAAAEHETFDSLCQDLQEFIDEDEDYLVGSNIRNRLSNEPTTARIIMQKVWASKVAWDEVIGDNEFVLWKEWILNFPRIELMSIDRCYQSPIAQFKTAELHIFCDASSAAYAAVAYWRFQVAEDKFHVAFIMAKGRVVAPKSTNTIPRLELQAAVCAVRPARRQQQCNKLASVQQRHLPEHPGSTMDAWTGDAQLRFRSSSAQL